MSQVSFSVSKDEGETIRQIVLRAEAIALKHRVALDRTELTMDLTAAHCNGCRLRLGDLLAAPDVDFGHDVFGIRKHIDRKTGELRECFVPRYAQREKASA